jgi:hypothetical protein
MPVSSIVLITVTCVSSLLDATSKHAAERHCW